MTRTGSTLRFAVTLVIPLVLAGVTAYVFERVVDQQVAVTDAAQRSDALAEAVGRLELALLEAESAQRGYALSSEPRFRTEYLQVVDEVYAALDDVTELDIQGRYQPQIDAITERFAIWRSTAVAPTLAARSRSAAGSAQLASELEAALLRAALSADEDGAWQLDAAERALRMLMGLQQPRDVIRALNAIGMRIEVEKALPGSARTPLLREASAFAESMRSVERDVVAAIRNGVGVASMDVMREAASTIALSARANTEAALREANESVAFSRTVGMAAPFTLVLLGFAALFLLPGRLVGSIRRLSDVASRLAHGDVNARVQPHGRDPLRSVGHAFDAMADRVAQRERLTAQGRTLAALLPAAESVEEAFELVAEHLAAVDPHGGGTVARRDHDRGDFEVVRAWGTLADTAPKRFPPEACWAARRSREHRSTPDDGARCQHLHGGGICIPLDVRGNRYGMLSVELEATPDRDPYADASGSRTAAANSPRLDAVRNAAEQLALTWSTLQLQERLRAESIRDPLTGLFNRRYLEEITSAELARSQREGTSVAAIFLDVDRFKALNDTHGHAAGDAVLRALGAVLAGGVRPGDVVARYGGEEFTVVLPHADLAIAAERAERLRLAVHGLPLPAGIDQVSASFGVAASPLHGRDASTLFAAADAALYRAKREGRDRVVTADTAN